MYKRITHNIVEEHFEKPVQQINRRYYPDGMLIPMELPQSYSPGSAEASCATCLARNPTNNWCAMWHALVRADYVCDAWIKTI
jgi:hypothetical protein